MKQRYVVVRAAPQGVSAPAPQVRIDVEELTPDEVTTLRGSPDVRGVVPDVLVISRDAPPVKKAKPTKELLPWSTKTPRALVAVNHAVATGAGVSVAVLDTGWAKDHPEFAHLAADPARHQLKDLVDPDGDASDTNGHGTHTAGLVAGAAPGSTVGIAPGVARLLVARVARATHGTVAALLEGLIWALTQDADVIVIPRGVNLQSTTRDYVDQGMPPAAAADAARQAHNSLVGAVQALLVHFAGAGDPAVVVAAAGNFRVQGSPAPPVAPAAAEGALAIGACHVRQPHEPLDSSHDDPAVVAPGDGVRCPSLTGYDTETGTSAACGVAGGVAALWVEVMRARGAMRPRAEAALAMVSHAIPGDHPPERVGAGLLQAPQQR